MAFLDSAGAGDDAGPPSGPSAGPPAGPPGRPQMPNAMMRPAPGASPPGAGNVGDALGIVASCVAELTRAQGLFPHGSKELGEISRVIGILNKIGPSQGQIGPQNVTQMQQSVASAIRNILGGRARQMMAQNPQAMPTAPQPGG